MRSIVASVKVPAGHNKEVVFGSVAKAMKLAKWNQFVKGKNIVLKINSVWDKLYPSVVTSPMVVEGVIRVIRNSIKRSKITIVDTNTSAFMNADVAFKVLGIYELAKRYKVDLINLSETKFKVIPYSGLVLNHLKVSEVLLNADTIVTIPVMKTHALSTITCALKNQWGCIHDFRHNYHTVLAEALADVNKYFKNKITFCVVDALIAMEGTGPKTGTPVEVGHIFASHDLVAADSLSATTMGFNPRKIKHLVRSEAVGVGRIGYKLVGERPPKLKFIPPRSTQLAFFVEMGLRNLGEQIEWFLFKTPMVHLFRVASKTYHDLWWLLYGKSRGETMMRTRWGQMWQTYTIKGK